MTEGEIMNDRAKPKGVRRTGFQHPIAFWFGAVVSTAGVLLHLPMYIDARVMGYRMVGMPADPEMIIGMVLIGIGLISSFYGLLPARVGAIAQQATRVRVRALDDAPIRPQHVYLLLVMAIAVLIDNMKPITLAFVAPGMAKEYGLKSPLNPLGHIPVSLIPLAGITGTVIGAFIWGSLADRIGRRPAILFASMLFVTTAICGAMPEFVWNLVMCFFMGIAAGGLLPIAFALIAETIPARHRSWLMVLVGGNVAGAYVVTSWLAAELTPTFSWRIMWLLGIPTGLLLIVLNRWIPESPRYLLAIGRTKAAEQVMVRYGAAVVTEPELLPEPLAGQVGNSFAALFRRPFTGAATAITILAIGAGLVTYGFQLWIPTNLQHLGFTAVNTDYILRNAALIGLPLILVVAWLYGFWSSRKTIILLSALSALALFAFVIGGNGLAHHHLLLSALLVIPLAGISSLIAVAAAYSSEIYPTAVRSRGVGLSAGMTKVGGVLIIGIVAAATAIPSIAVTALIGAVPLVVAVAIFWFVGPETNRRRLEEITRGEFASAESLSTV
jgi:putative MFS transporter